MTGRSVDCVECKSVRAPDALALDIACVWEHTPAIRHRHCHDEHLKKPTAAATQLS